MNESEYADVCCINCGHSLNEKPIIKLDDWPDMYACYSCAKKIIPIIDKEYLDESTKEYEKELEKYDTATQIKFLYYSERDAFKKNIIWWRIQFLVFPCTVLTYILQDGRIGYTVSAFIISFIYLMLFVDIDYSEFIKNHPEPIGEPPVRPKLKIKKCNHYCIEHKYNGKNKGYRLKILERDEYTCQWCLTNLSASKLEVHHIIPRSKGGNDHPANLITLCLACHKKEDWYDHFHKYKNRA